MLDKTHGFSFIYGLKKSKDLINILHHMYILKLTDLLEDARIDPVRWKFLENVMDGINIGLLTVYS